jgi:hypothetical protein
MSAQRPIMDPLFVRPFTEEPKPSAARKWLVPLLMWFGRALVSRPLAPRRPAVAEGTERRARPRSAVGELFRAAICQLLFLPLALSGTAVLLVYLGTHPSIPSINSDPGADGSYFESVSLTSADGTGLSAWFIPALDAHRIVDQRDLALRGRTPAVVLAHDFGNSMQQMLPLVAPLHDEGLNVMVVGLRGVGAAGLPRGQTFGIDEAADVRAATDWLVAQPRVDVDRIAAVGIGTGATAALLAAQRDAHLHVLILADPVQDADDVIAFRIGPRDRRFRCLDPACRWVFDLYYHVEADEANYAPLAHLTATHPTLFLPAGSARADYLDKKVQTKIRRFLREQLHTMDVTADAAQAR